MQQVAVAMLYTEGKKQKAKQVLEEKLVRSQVLSTVVAS